jgi:hypothetical protein
MATIREHPRNFYRLMLDTIGEEGQDDGGEEGQDDRGKEGADDRGEEGEVPTSVDVGLELARLERLEFSPERTRHAFSSARNFVKNSKVERGD